MKLSVIGCGYLGAVHAAAMASIGHDVVGIDVDERKVATLSQGEAPFFEPGLPEILSEGIASGRLRFTTDMSAAHGADVHFVGVGTPQQKDGYAADMTYRQRGDRRPASPTCAPATSSRASRLCRSAPPRISPNESPSRAPRSSGTRSFSVRALRSKTRSTPTGWWRACPPANEGERAAGILREVYHPAIAKQTPFIVTDYATAELVKVAANAFLATKISFINAMAEIAEVTGADVTQLADAIGHDARIGRRFLGAGIGFGGGCLPKDIRAFSARAEELGRGESVAFLREVDAINLRRRERAVAARGRSVRRQCVQEEHHGARSGLQAAQRRHPRFARP